jgi:signal transduction histidine kinase
MAAMKKRPDNALTKRRSLVSITTRYPMALAAYVDRGEESALLSAYELGRQGLDEGAGVLELTAVHERALEALLEKSGGPSASVQTSRRAWEFFAQSLASFEMAQRGFREAIAGLQSANALLRLSSEDLARANQELATTNESIERERATLVAVIGSMSDGLVVTDHRGLVIAHNERASELLEAQGETVIGLDFADLGRVAESLTDEPDRVEAFWSTASGNVDDRPSIEFRTTVTPRRDIRVELFPIAGGPQSGVGLLVRDVTPERELNRTKDELVAVVSHELRNPLSSIVGFAHLLQDGTPDEDEARQWLATIVREGNRLAALVNDFLDLQRIDRGADRLHPASVDIGLVLMRAPELVADVAGGHRLVMDVPDRLPTVWADAERIWQVVINLISNARKYSPAGGEIRVSARVVTGSVEVSVSDQGLGLDAEEISRIFDEFYRVDSADRREIAGTGLGLSIARKIIEAHGGRIWAESPGPNRGSRFLFTIPTSRR